jgi:hypothetical protein
MSIIWDRDRSSPGIAFSFGGWMYQLHSSHFVTRAIGGSVMCVGGYR